MGSFDEWLAADAAWFTANSEFLSQQVFQWFLRTGKWPEVGPLQHELYKLGDRTTKVADIANSKPVIPGSFNPAIKQNISLQARHLINVPEASTLLALTVRAAQAAVDVFLATPAGQQCSITSADVEAPTPGQKKTLELLPEFVFTDHPTPFAGGGSGPDGWMLGVYPEVVMEFEEVSSPQQYIGQQLKIIRGWSLDFDGRSKQWERQGYVAPARLVTTSSNDPLQAFVVMPFAGKRSARVHQMIEEAIATFDGLVTSVRADQIADPGHITQQIVDELETSAFIIADITGANPNVAWELGYAYDNDKPCVILRCKSERKPAPFDIYDQRRTEYSRNPTHDDRARLIEMITRAVDQIRNRQSHSGLGVLFKTS